MSLLHRLLNRVLREENNDGESGGAPTPLPTPHLSGRAAAMSQIIANANAQVAGDLADFDEESGTATPRPALEEQEAEPEPDDSVIFTPPEKEEPEEPTKPKMIPIVVDGQTIEVEESRVIDSGKRTLQKEAAADRRLQEANRQKQEADREKQEAAELFRRARAAAAAAGVDDQNQALSQDAPQYQAPATPAIDPAALLNELENRVGQNVLAHIKAQRAVDTFRQEFPEIAADPNLWQIAANLEQRRLEEAAALGEPLDASLEAYRKHGAEIRGWLASKAPQPQQAQQPAVSADKQERKRTITAVSAVNAKAPAPAAPKVLTVAEQIEQMRLQRKQGRSLKPMR